MLSIISFLLLIIIIVALICFIVLVFYSVQILITKNDNDLIKMVSKNKYYGHFFFGTFILFALVFIFDNIETNLFRKKILEKINSTNENQITLTINQVKKENDSIKLKLLNIQKPSYGRKTGNPEIKISLSNSIETNDFLLKRDFQNRKKYWVEYKVAENESKLIGQIITNQLDYIK